MGPGLNNWASSIEDLVMVQGEEFLIEWDSRWSTDPFDFTIEFVEDCPDQLLVHLPGMETDTFEAAQSLFVRGPVTKPYYFNTPGEVVIDSNLNVIPPGYLETRNQPCLYSNGFSWAVFGSSESPISDNNTIEIELEVPAIFNTSLNDIDVLINLEHTYVGDLVIELVNPDNKVLRIWDRYCATENNLHFVVDEQGLPKSLCGDEWRANGHLFAPGQIPSTPLADWTNGTAVGTWKIRISDLAGGDQGVVNRVGLFFR